MAKKSRPKARTAREPATIHRLRTRADRLREEQAEMLRQFVLDVDLPERTVSDVLRVVDKHRASVNGWTFIMLSPDQNAAVVNWLANHSKRPKTAMQVWSVLFTGMRRDTGEVLFTTKEIAEIIGAPRSNVSSVLTELAQVNAILKRRDVAGSRGAPAIRIYMNPNVATNLTGQERDKAQNDCGQVDLVDFVKRERA